ncbi:hypothetical protein MNBD_GAMMA13-1968, partial [hydrothermal vent metagenome]
KPIYMRHYTRMSSAKRLRPPATTAPADSPRSHTSRYALIAFVLLLVLGLVVMLLLPQWVADNPPETVSIGEQVPQSRIDTAEIRQQAEQSLQAFLRLQAEMNLANALVWGADEWSKAESRVQAGDRLFGERRFGDAYQAYTEGLGLLENLQGERLPRLQASLQAAQAALEQNQAAVALDQFALALSIEVDNTEALQGQARAQVRDAVLQAMAAADEPESDRQFKAAGDAYRAALALDGTYEPAHIGLARVEQQLAEQAFQIAMDSALVALDAGRFSEAANTLMQAAQIDPQHQALLDARQRLQAARREAKLKRLRSQAAAQASSENWNKVVNLYNKALQIDAGAGFARQGLAQAQQRAVLNARFDHYLEQPERLYSKQPLQQAEQLLSTTPVAALSEPKLAARIKRLQARVAMARQPLRIELRSDSETEVTLFHVGQLGLFSIKQLDLLPGSYTLTGTRTGYRDVRQVFKLTPGDALTVIDIRARERL